MNKDTKRKTVKLTFELDARVAEWLPIAVKIDDTTTDLFLNKAIMCSVKAVIEVAGHQTAEVFEQIENSLPGMTAKEAAHA